MCDVLLIYSLEALDGCCVGTRRLKEVVEYILSIAPHETNRATLSAEEVNECIVVL